MNAPNFASQAYFQEYGADSFLCAPGPRSRYFAGSFVRLKFPEQLKDQLFFLEQIEILRLMLNARRSVRHVQCVLDCPGIRMLVEVAQVPHDQISDRWSFLNDF